MADELLEQVRDYVEGPIDFAGQKKAEQLSTWILIATGIVAFFVGYVQENVFYTLWVGLFGTGLVFMMVIPPWPAFNEDPETWLKTADANQTAGIVVDGKKIN